MSLPPWLHQLVEDNPPNLRSYLELHLHGLTGTTAAFERDEAQQRLTPDQFQEIEAKLQRTDLVAHPFGSVSRHFPGRLRPVWVSPGNDQERVRLRKALDAALQFFRDQMGLRVVVQEPLEIDQPGWVQADSQYLVDNARGLIHLALPQIRRQSGTIWCLCLPSTMAGNPIGISLRPHLLLVRPPSQADPWIAHELGHCLLGLPDLQGSRPLEGELSLMGYGWHGPVAHTYLGYRFKSACLTTPEAQARLDQAVQAEAGRRWKRAVDHYHQALALDPWHLAAALRSLALDRSAAVARDIVSRFPTPSVQTRVADIMGRHWLPLVNSPEEHQELASWHRARQRPGATRQHLLQGGEKLPPVWQGVQEACHRMNLPDRFHEAGSLLEQALKRAPYDRDVRESMGIFLCYSGQPSLARKQFRLAVLYGGARRWPPVYHYYLALARHNLPALLHSLEKLTMPFQHGLVCQLLGCSDRALELLGQAHRQRGTALTAAYLCWCQGQSEQACQWAVRSLQRQLNRPYAWELLARLQPDRDWSQQLFSRLPHWPALLIPRPPGGH